MSTQNYKPRRILAIGAVILGLLIFNGWFLFSQFESQTQHQQSVVHTAEVLNELNLVLSGSKDVETGARGYLLSSEQEYLEPYRTGMNETWEHLRKLQALVREHPQQAEAALLLEDAVKQRFRVLEEMVQNYSKNSNGQARLRFGMIKGKVAMDNLRDHVRRMSQMETELLDQRIEEAAKSRKLFLIALIVTTLLSAIVTSFAMLRIAQSQARAALEALQKAQEAKEREVVAEVARLLSGDITLEKAGERVMAFFSKSFSILAGRLFMSSMGSLKPVAAYGVSSGNLEPERVASAGTNLVRAAYNRKDVWEIDQVPNDYWHISSSLGSAVPENLTFVPVCFQQENIGVLELASFQKLSDEKKHLFSLLKDVLGVGLNAAQARAHMQELLEETQQQAEELQSQQEELKTNNEELEQQARVLENQQQALNERNKSLQMAQVELKTKATELERSSQYKSDFMAKMSHELRTPLNGLLILSTLLAENKERNLTEQQMEYAKSIHSAGSDLLILINDILDLSKIEARKLSIRPDEFELDSLLQGKRRGFEPQAKAKGLKFEIKRPDALGKCKLFTDRHRLEQILRNFLSNAVKFTEKGKISVEVKSDSNEDNLIFTVRDTGIGIPKQNQGAIFDAFEQADSSVSRKYGGTGLGLTISRELATLLGGEIWVESEVDRGSAFSLRIPKKLPQEAAETIARTPHKLRPPAPAIQLTGPSPSESNEAIKVAVDELLKKVNKKKKTILIVEDDERFRKSIVDAVKSYGFHPLEIDDGEVALAFLSEFTPDAILLDIKLPGISGLGILEMIKHMPHLRHVPVHMVSALQYQHNALRMGALGYLTKPVTIDKVRSAVERIENMISKKYRRALLIEDDEVQNKAIAELISGNDIEVVSVKTGKDAVKALKKQNFDCVILDLTLPDVSGFDLLAEISSLEISIPPIVVYTGKDLSDEEEEYLHKHSGSIVIKGARSPERLLDEVNLFLHRVESLLPSDKREMLTQLRSQERSFDGKTVLVVDDDIRNIFALTSALEAKGLSIIVARNGQEALDTLDKQTSIDLVLMDIMMPKMNGMEAMRRIRSSHDARLRAIPIVALTAKAMREDHEKCMEAGASDYLPKPVNLHNLMTVLKVWLAPKGFLA